MCVCVCEREREKEKKEQKQWEGFVKFHLRNLEIEKDIRTKRERDRENKL